MHKDGCRVFSEKAGRKFYAPVCSEIRSSGDTKHYHSLLHLDHFGGLVLGCIKGGGRAPAAAGSLVGASELQIERGDGMLGAKAWLDYACCCEAPLEPVGLSASRKPSRRS